ncbi:MAG TPA: GGDEF domain-containing protein [Anaerolineaceae bacterium]|nr:GGDEF domain-containing protein [Anaerolineaceae bacterium]
MDSYQALSKEQLIDKVKELTIELENVQTEKNKQLEQMSRTDFLTKLNNRSELVERLGYETKRATRTKEPLSLVMFNVDDLKQVNDRYGQSVGDKVLTEIAKIITSSVRVTDIVGRFGGDEFMLILPACKAADALTVAEQIRESVELNHFEDQIRVSTSGGIHQFNGESIDQLIDAVGKLVLRAKQNGQNRIEVSAA